MDAPRHSEILHRSVPSHATHADDLTTIHEGLLLPASAGHIAIGANPPLADRTWIEAHLARVEDAFRWTRKTGRERGFLAYARREGGPPIPEAMSQGTETEITWRWAHSDSTVAFTFHTHPGKRSIAVPSGLDVLGATVRGDHVHYILDMQGRLVGWRFREPRNWPRACQEALRSLSEARSLDRAFVGFLRESLEGMVPRFMEPCYGARLELARGAMLLTPAPPRDLVPSSYL